jgi:hypothetical protein
MTDREDEIEATARKLANDKARLQELETRADDLEEELEQSKPPLSHGWKGDVV